MEGPVFGLLFVPVSVFSQVLLSDFVVPIIKLAAAVVAHTGLFAAAVMRVLISTD